MTRFINMFRRNYKVLNRCVVPNFILAFEFESVEARTSFSSSSKKGNKTRNTGTGNILWKRKQSHYEVLGILPSATHREIRAAFLKMSKECHPDINKHDPDTHKKIVLVNEAYSVLGKPLSRREYDLTLNTDLYANRYPSSTASQARAYGYSRDSGDYYHYRGHDQWSRHPPPHEQSKAGVLFNFSLLTFAMSIVAVSIIFQYMHKIIPNGVNKSFISKEDISKHDFIMSAEHEGKQIDYYAVRNKKNPNNFEVIAVTKTKTNASSDEHQMEELNKIYVHK